MNCEKPPAFFQLSVDSCKLYQKTLNCDSLRSDPEAAKHIRSCDVKSICDDALNAYPDQLKGCFSGVADIAIEFWDAIVAVPGLAQTGFQNLRSCLSSSECRSNALKASAKNAPYALMVANPILAPLLFAHLRMTGQITDADVKKMTEISKDLIEKGKDYLVKQGVKLACFDQKTQAEMICYGVFSVVSPSAAAGVLTKLPKLGKLMKVAGLASKEVAVADLARVAKLSNAERLSEAEKVLGRSLSEHQKKALLEAHEVGAGTGRGYGTYSAADLKQKADILKTAGFSDAERDQLMRQGVAGLFSDTQQARNFANEARLQADKLRASGDVKAATNSYRSSADSYEVYIKDAKAAKSERDYAVGAGINAHAERYDKAAEYYLKSKSSIPARDRAEAVFESLNREKDELRVIAARNPGSAGAQKAYEDHRKLIDAVLKNKDFSLGDAWRRELMRP